MWLSIFMECTSLMSTCHFQFACDFDDVRHTYIHWLRAKCDFQLSGWNIYLNKLISLPAAATQLNGFILIFQTFVVYLQIPKYAHDLMCLNPFQCISNTFTHWNEKQKKQANNKRGKKPSICLHASLAFPNNR